MHVITKANNFEAKAQDNIHKVLLESIIFRYLEHKKDFTYYFPPKNKHSSATYTFSFNNFRGMQ